MLTLLRVHGIIRTTTQADKKSLQSSLGGLHTDGRFMPRHYKGYALAKSSSEMRPVSRKHCRFIVIRNVGSVGNAADPTLWIAMLVIPSHRSTTHGALHGSKHH